ncbi:MAG: class I SAM-dependent methyltransferase [Bacteroidota bacterium]
MSEAFKALEPLIAKKSNVKDAREFHSIVNVVFHDHEAKYYDSLHEEMWQNLPREYHLLVNDALPHITNKTGLKLLDIGCGTGLATQLLLNTALGDFIDEIHLLDTSSVMLGEAKKRAKAWGKKIKIIHGDVTASTDTYDVIIFSSLLHHIPDLGQFLSRVSDLQNPGGLIISIHDPALEALESDVYRDRCKQFADNFNSHKAPTPFINRVINKIKRTLNPQDYIGAVNKTLLQKGVINQQLTADEIWSVTDVHVEGLPYSASDGISKQTLVSALPYYELISYRTYCFFGLLSSKLTVEHQKKEQELSLNGDLNGRNFGSVWLKKQEL